MSPTETVQAPAHPFVARYEQVERALARGAPQWLRDLRRRGIDRFAHLGFPGTKLEAWRNTDTAPIARTHFEAAPEDPGVTPETFAEHRLDDPAATELVFVNGRYRPDLSRVGQLPDETRVGSLAQALTHEADAVQAILGSQADLDGNPFVALNTAYFTDGAFLHVPDEVVLDHPVHVLHVAAAPHGPVAAHPRHLVRLGRHAQATVIETYAGTGHAFTNAVTEALLGENATLDHVKVQREDLAAQHLGVLDAVQARSSTLRSHVVSLGGALVRNEINTLFDDEGGSATLDGLYHITGDQRVDNVTTIDHAKPHCTSRELYKGILDGQSRGAFTGNITVRAGAQKSDADQHNPNLILSEGALVDTTPQLEINADDVKCAHGSTIGQIDRDAIFYLRSRGIEASTARDLLVYAFAREMVDRIRNEPLRRQLGDVLLERLPQGAAVRGAAQ